MTSDLDITTLTLEPSVRLIVGVSLKKDSLPVLFKSRDPRRGTDQPSPRGRAPSEASGYFQVLPGSSPITGWQGLTPWKTFTSYPLPACPGALGLWLQAEVRTMLPARLFHGIDTERRGGGSPPLAP